jgi:hypothetical protein
VDKEKFGKIPSQAVVPGSGIRRLLLGAHRRMVRHSPLVVGRATFINTLPMDVSKQIISAPHDASGLSALLRRLAAGDIGYGLNDTAQVEIICLVIYVV